MKHACPLPEALIFQNAVGCRGQKIKDRSHVLGDPLGGLITPGFEETIQTDHGIILLYPSTE